MDARRMYGALVIALAVCGNIAAGQQRPAASLAEGFSQMLDRVDAAQLALQNGDAAPFKALWSRADDITLAGGLGGPIETGWGQISRRLDWVATQFTKGTHSQRRIASAATAEMGYVVQTEHITFTPPGQTVTATRDYRVTMVFRREPDGWRLVHRQADTQTAVPPSR